MASPKIFQYLIFVEPVVVPAAPVVPSMDWDVQQPTAPLVAARPLVAGVSAPVQPGTDVTRLDWAFQLPAAPRAFPRPQSDGVIAPFQPPAAPTVFLDWLVEEPTQPPPPRSAAQQPSWTAPLWVPDVTTPAPILSWQGYQPSAIWPLTRPFPVAQQPFFSASPTMFQSVPPAAVIAGQISVDYPEMPTNMSGGSMLGGMQ